MSAAARTNQIAGHLASAPGGLLKDEVAIITGSGACCTALRRRQRSSCTRCGCRSRDRQVLRSPVREGRRQSGRCRHRWKVSSSCVENRLNKVLTNHCSHRKAEEVVKEISAAGGKAISVVADITNDDFPKKVVKATVESAPSKPSCTTGLRMLRLLILSQRLRRHPPHREQRESPSGPRTRGRADFLLRQAGWTHDKMLHNMSDE